MKERNDKEKQREKKDEEDMRMPTRVKLAGA